LPQSTSPPHPSALGPQSIFISAHVFGVHGPPPSGSDVPHTFGVPPPPHVAGAVHVPQSINEPQPSPCLPHDAPSSTHVFGLHPVSATPHLLALARATAAADRGRGARAAVEHVAASVGLFSAVRAEVGARLLLAAARVDVESGVAGVVGRRRVAEAAVESSTAVEVASRPVPRSTSAAASECGRHDRRDEDVTSEASHCGSSLDSGACAVVRSVLVDRATADRARD
jgi:hypothetical protein